MAYPSDIPTTKQDWANTTPVTDDLPSALNLLASIAQALMEKVGTNGSLVNTTLDYLLKNSASVDPGHKHTLTAMNDIDLTGLQNGDSLVYDGPATKFKPRPSSTPDASSTAFGSARAAASTAIALGNPTITVASPAVVTLTSHNLLINDRIKFTTTGALPTGITAGTEYFVISSGLTANTFQFSATVGGSAVTTTGTQSGTHTLTRTSPVFVGDNDPRMTGSSGAALSAANKPVDSADTFGTGQIPRASVIGAFTPTAAVALAQGDPVKISASQTMTKLLGQSPSTTVGGTVKTEVTFQGVILTSVQSCQLDDTHTAIVYKEQATSDLKVIIAAIDAAGATTYGSAVTVTGDGEYPSIAKIDSTHFVIAYKDTADSNYGKVRYCTVSSGTTVSLSSATYFYSSGSGIAYATACDYDPDTSKLVVLFLKGSAASDFQAIVATLSGSSFSFGSPVTPDTVAFTSSGDGSLGVRWHTNDAFTAIYRPASSNTRVIAATVSGTVPTFGTAQTNILTMNGNTEVSVAAVDATTVIFAGCQSNGGALKAATISGTSISLGAEVIFDSGTNIRWVNLEVFNKQTFVVGFIDSTAGAFRICSLSGTTITAGTKTQYTTPANVQCTNILSRGRVWTSFNDQTNNLGQGVATDLSTTDDYSYRVGLVASTVAQGATASVVSLRGALATVPFVVTPGTLYYVQTDGTLGTTATSALVGQGYNATQIILA